MQALRITDGDHIAGNKQAKNILIQYGDYECPACKHAFLSMQLVKKHFGEKLQFVFRHFPLADVHAFAEISAETAEFAGLHHRFWKMHELIYTYQNKLTIPLLFEFAEKLSLPVNELEVALQQATFQKKIKKDIESGKALGVTSTPTFFINGKKYKGAGNFTDIIQAIEEIFIE